MVKRLDRQEASMRGIYRILLESGHLEEDGRIILRYSQEEKH
jgi:hypothetical protein